MSDYNVDPGTNRAETIAGSPGEIVQRLDKARDAIAEILKENHIVGLASHVIFKGEIIWTANMGYRNADQKKARGFRHHFPHRRSEPRLHGSLRGSTGVQKGVEL